MTLTKKKGNIINNNNKVFDDKVGEPGSNINTLRRKI